MRKSTAVLVASILAMASMTLVLGGDDTRSDHSNWTDSFGVGCSLTSFTTGNADTLNYNLFVDLLYGENGGNLLQLSGLYLPAEKDATTNVDRLKVTLG